MSCFMCLAFVFIRVCGRCPESASGLPLSRPASQLLPSSKTLPFSASSCESATASLSKMMFAKLSFSNRSASTPSKTTFVNSIGDLSRSEWAEQFIDMPNILRIRLFHSREPIDFACVFSALPTASGLPAANESTFNRKPREPYYFEFELPSRADWRLQTRVRRHVGRPTCCRVRSHYPLGRGTWRHDQERWNPPREAQSSHRRCVRWMPASLRSDRLQD